MLSPQGDHPSCSFSEWPSLFPCEQAGRQLPALQSRLSGSLRGCYGLASLGWGGRVEFIFFLGGTRKAHGTDLMGSHPAHCPDLRGCISCKVVFAVRVYCKGRNGDKEPGGGRGGFTHEHSEGTADLLMLFTGLQQNCKKMPC